MIAGLGEFESEGDVCSRGLCVGSVRPKDHEIGSHGDWAAESRNAEDARVMVDDTVSGQRMRVNVERMRPYYHPPLSATVELKDVVAHIHGECELRLAYLLSISQINDRTYIVLVERVGLDGGSTWESAGDVYENAPGFWRTNCGRWTCRQQ